MKLFSIALITIMLVFPSMVFSQIPAEVQSFIEQKQFAAAIQSIDQRLRQNPNDDSLWFLKSRILRWQNQPEAAMKIVQSLLERSANDVDYLFEYARLLVTTHEIVAADVQLDRARELSPNYFELWQFQYNVLINSKIKSHRDKAQWLNHAAQQNFSKSLAKASPPKTKSYKNRVATFLTLETLDYHEAAWIGGSLMFAHQLTSKTNLGFEINGAQRYGLNDAKTSISLNQRINNKLITQITVGTSRQALFFPELLSAFALTHVVNKNYSIQNEWTINQYSQLDTLLYKLRLHYDKSYHSLNYGFYLTMDREQIIAISHSLQFGFDYGVYGLRMIVSGGRELDFDQTLDYFTHRTLSSAIIANYSFSSALALNVGVDTNYYRNIGARYGISSGILFKF